MDVEEIDEPGRNGLRFHYLKIGPLNLPESIHMAIVKEVLQTGGQDSHHEKISLDIFMKFKSTKLNHKMLETKIMYSFLYL